jgi:hypothetical protein
MLVEMNPAVVNRFGRFVRGRLHAPQAIQDGAHLSLIQPRQGRFDPFERLSGVSILSASDPVKILGTMVIIEHLAGCRSMARN